MSTEEFGFGEPSVDNPPEPIFPHRASRHDKSLKGNQRPTKRVSQLERESVLVEETKKRRQVRIDAVYGKDTSGDSRVKQDHARSEHDSHPWTRSDGSSVLGTITALKDKLADLSAGEGKKSAGPHRHSFLWGCVEYYNDIGFRIPIYNIVHTFLSFNTHQLLWSQLEFFLVNIAIVSALILALAITFASAVTYPDLVSADARFNVGLPGQNLTTPWDNAFPSTVRDPITKEDLTGKCPYPCYADRVIDWDGTFITGNYSRWWDLTKDVDGTIVQQFNFYCLLSATALCTAVLGTVLLLFIAPLQMFNREENVHSYANALVLKTWTFWIKFCVMAIIFFTVIGTVSFFFSIQYMVYIKFTDNWVANHAEEDAEFLSSEKSYSYVSDATTWIIYAPCLVMMIIVSMGQWAAYTYPFHPFGEKQSVYSVEGYFLFRPFNYLREKLFGYDPRNAAGNEGIAYISEYRLARSLELTEFLVNECGLPQTAQLVGSGPRDLAFDVFMSTASGVPAFEAEIVTAALMDVHIDSVNTLVRLVLTEDTKDWIGQIKGISRGAALVIYSTIRDNKERYLQNAKRKSIATNSWVDDALRESSPERIALKARERANEALAEADRAEAAANSAKGVTM
eukprot:m.9730 g.9730  ORF g.9730 m.9730 type:complete len:625 (+) comp4123_c0_seq1:94-1968(+)